MSIVGNIYKDAKGITEVFKPPRPSVVNRQYRSLKEGRTVWDRLKDIEHYKPSKGSNEPNRDNEKED